MTFDPAKLRATTWGVAATALLGALIVFGSRRLDHFDAALVGYTFATLFATFGITYRYAMWLQRPPTRMYWRRGWRTFLLPQLLGPHLLALARRFFLELAANRFIFRRDVFRGTAHLLIMWGCILAAAITFPLVWGWIHFETVPGEIDMYRAYVFGLAVRDFPVESLFAFVVFHGLVWASVLVIAGVMLAFRRRMIDHGAVAVQQFGFDMMPLVLLFAVSVTGLMLTASALIVAAPARYAERMFRSFAPEISERLWNYRYDTITRVSLGYRCDQIKLPLDLPWDVAMAHSLWTDYPSRVPDDHLLIQLGVRIPPDRATPEALVSTLQQQLGWPTNPAAVLVARWPEADPLSCLMPGHRENMDAIERLLPQGVALAGSDYRAQRFQDRVEQGQEAARRIGAWLREK